MHLCVATASRNKYDLSVSGAESDNIFCQGIQPYASAYLRKYALRWAMVALLPLCIFIVAGMADNRWWFVGLMLLFIIYPMAASFAWLSLLGRPQMARLLRPQSVEFSPEGFQLTFYTFPHPDEPTLPMDSVFISKQEIRSSHATARTFSFNLVKGAPFDLILIPAKYMPPELFNSFII